MYITPCPKCGRLPVTQECCRINHYKNGIRRRLVMCPHYCSIIYDKDSPWVDHTLLTWGFIFEGEGDDNTIYKVWNKKIEEALSNRKEWQLI